MIDYRGDANRHLLSLRDVMGKLARDVQDEGIEPREALRTARHCLGMAGRALAEMEQVFDNEEAEGKPKSRIILPH